MTLFNNFAVEVVALKGNHVGLIQSVREIPGFLAFLVVYFLLIGGMITIAGIWGMTQNPTSTNLPPQRKKMVLRKKYWLEYSFCSMA